MSLPTAEQVTNMYLYGTLSRPANLLDSAILNHRSSTSPNGISVSAVEYMDSGAGRFVNSANFEIVEKFFSDASLEAKVYTKSEILQYFGYLSPAGEALGYAGYSHHARVENRETGSSHRWFRVALPILPSSMRFAAEAAPTKQQIGMRSAI